MRPSFSSSSLVPPTTRSPRFTWVSDGKPFRRLLLTSKAIGFEVFFLDSHDAPPALGNPRARHNSYKSAKMHLILASRDYSRRPGLFLSATLPPQSCTVLLRAPGSLAGQPRLRARRSSHAAYPALARHRRVTDSLRLGWHFAFEVCGVACTSFTSPFWLSRKSTQGTRHQGRLGRIIIGVLRRYDA